MWGLGPLLQFPHPLRAVLVLLTLLFFALVPSSHQDLPGSVYSFPLVRYSCLLLAGVLHGLLCLKVYSWCIRGERCTPHPPTPLPSCSLLKLIFNMLLLKPKTSQGNRTHNLYPVPGIFHTCVISCPGWLLWSPNSFCSPHSSQWTWDKVLRSARACSIFDVIKISLLMSSGYFAKMLFLNVNSLHFQLLSSPFLAWIKSALLLRALYNATSPSCRLITC